MIGERVGAYRLLSKLGEGGMGVVYVAEHVELGHRVAVKLLLPELSQNQEVVQRFFNEARAATRIKHHGIVQVVDFGRHASGVAYFAMELLEGESLSARLLRLGSLPTEQLALLGRQACNALAAAHDQGIVHRDLKPDNLMLVDDTDVVGGERVKILDFGIAKLAAEAQGISLKTRTGSVMGTPYYMSPEQCRGAGEVDKRSDIYSLGCILFEMACGRAPFQGEGFGDILGQHQYVAPPSPRLLAPHVPETLEAIILRALAKDPGARQQSMQELGAALGALTPAAGMTGAMATSRAATPASVPPQPLPMAVTTLGGAVGQVANGGNRKRSRTPLFALIGLVVVAGGATSFYLTRDGATQQPRAAAATPTPTPSPATVPTPSPTTAPTPSPTPAPTPSPTAASTTPSIPEPASDAVETMAPSPIAAAPPSPAPPTSATPEVTPSPQAALPAGPERLSKPAFVAGMTAIKDKVLACFDVSGLAIRVKLTVSPSGSVSSASVTPFVERHLMERMQAMEKEAAYSQVTRVREGELCAEAVVKKAKFPRFSGPPTKFSYEYAR